MLCVEVRSLVLGGELGDLVVAVGLGCENVIRESIVRRGGISEYADEYEGVWFAKS